jgi:soluble lytic murein transglycosylase-like protein
MFKEASSFFAIALILLVGACVYIESQGGSPFAIHASVQGDACKDYRCMARADATNAGISADLFERQIQAESGFNPDAISPAGAIGISQFMPSTAAGLGIDPHDPVQSLSGAASLMARYYTTYQSYEKALSAYNCGTDCVNRAVAQYGPNWEAGLPAETQNYIRVIMG